MADIHCHRCGGIITSPEGTMYLPPAETTPLVTPHTGLCTCERALIYGAPPGPHIHILRSASRN